MGYINRFYPAKSLSINDRHNIALQSMRHNHKITEIAAEKQVSRDFVYAQKNKALAGIKSAFNPANDSDVLFYSP